MDQLVPVSMINPAIAGLNKAQEGSTTLGPTWSLVAQNCYFDTAQRLAARKGYVLQGSAIGSSPAIEQVFEFIKADGTTNLISAANNKFYQDTAYTDITGATTPAANNWQFVNFTDKVFAFQQGHTPVTWTGAGNFANMTAASGSLPTGNAVCAAFGRLWAVDADGYTVKYCGLLDATNWGNAGSGSLDMRNVWTRGTDKVIGIYAFASKLVIFGERHIILYSDGTGSTLGINPSTMVVSDTVEGTGLISRDSVQTIKNGDMLYLSPNGVQSLGRAIIQKNNPIDSVDSQVKDYLFGYLGSETLTKVRSVFSQNDRFYLLILPVSNRVFCYDTLFPMDDGRLRITEWVFSAGPKCSVYRRNNGGLYFGFSGQIGLYTGYLDNVSTYRFAWNSHNMSLSNVQLQTGTFENRLKIPKRLGCVFYSETAYNVLMKWGFDFQGLSNSAVVVSGGGKVAEYGLAEYGSNGTYSTADSTAVAGVDIAEYGSQLTLSSSRANASSAGRWVQFGIEVDINGFGFAVQEFDAYIKVGRMI